MYALIMAGGSGTRLWPQSRQNQPKQLLKFIKNQTLLQTTYTRLRKAFSDSEIFVATINSYKGNIKKQVPQIPLANYSLETATKDRGPAIGLAALIMWKRDPESFFITAWSDHYIKNETAYFQALKSAEAFLKKQPGYFLTIGVRPSSAHTGFGYIELGKKLSGQVFGAKSFKEKPDAKTAKKFLQNKNYLWNTGYFVCKCETLLQLYKKHLPEVYKILMKIQPFIGTKRQQLAINKFYPQMPEVDIEKGLIEKLNKVAVVPGSFDWADVGSWQVIKDILSPDDKNLIQGEVLAQNSRGNLIYNFEKNKLVAGVGLENLLIVNTKDALLVVPKNRSEEVKQLVKNLKKGKKFKKYL